MAFPFTEENLASRLRLKAIVERLTDEDFTRTTLSGWTVAALLRRWKESGVDESPVDADAMNDALKPLCLALHPQKAVEICLASAEAADSELESISPELYEQIRASTNHFRFNRSLHRTDHLDEIERLLRSARR
jgi:hypothetical protein